MNVQDAQVASTQAAQAARLAAVLISRLSAAGYKVEGGRVLLPPRDPRQPLAMYAAEKAAFPHGPAQRISVSIKGVDALLASLEKSLRALDVRVAAQGSAETPQQAAQISALLDRSHALAARNQMTVDIFRSPADAIRAIEQVRKQNNGQLSFLETQGPSRG